MELYKVLISRLYHQDLQAILRYLAQTVSTCCRFGKNYEISPPIPPFVMALHNR
jgi:hypothetical protein